MNGIAAREATEQARVCHSLVQKPRVVRQDGRKMNKTTRYGRPVLLPSHVNGKEKKRLRPLKEVGAV